MMSRCGASISVAALMVLSAVPVYAQTPVEREPDREITQLRGDLYDAREDQQHTVFLVTPDGIIMGDPLNIAFAQWLRAELATRFPDLIVRYVLLTHHHFDRAHGGGALTGAERVGHDAYNRALSNARTVVPTFVGVQDRNQNGRFDPDELDSPDAALLKSRDRNRDGVVTPDELYGLVASVNTTYRDRRAITLGGKKVELVHSGDWHSPDMTVLFFPEERIVFAVDPPPVTVVPFAFGRAEPRLVYDWLHAVAPLDFDTLMFGDGTSMARSDLRAVTGYLDEMRASVASAYERGQTMAEIQTSAVPENLRGTPHYSGRLQQIADLYRTVRLRYLTVSGIGIANYGRVTPSFCSSYSFCSAGGVVPAAGAAIFRWLGRSFAVGGEVVFRGQSWSTRRQQATYDEEIALRQTRGSVLLRFVPAGAFTIFGGPSFTYGDARGMTIVRGRLVPAGGRHEIHERDTRLGLTAGVEIMAPLSERVGVVIPVQIACTSLSAPPVYWPNRLDVTAGIGLSFRVRRHID
jgi:glyoxylase-like metal-dependent hydrolase (beta-lactamase superfamily II)